MSVYEEVHDRAVEQRRRGTMYGFVMLLAIVAVIAAVILGYM